MQKNENIFCRKTTAPKAPDLSTGKGHMGWSGARRKMIKPKMDLAKALSMMGFGTALAMKDSGDRNALEELNTALCRQMETFDKKKKKVIETEKIEEKKIAQQDKIRDEIRTMHEAYQFLAKKYNNDKDRLKDKSQSIGGELTTDGSLEIGENDLEFKDIPELKGNTECYNIMAGAF